MSEINAGDKPVSLMGLDHYDSLIKAEIQRVVDNAVFYEPGNGDVEGEFSITEINDDITSSEYTWSSEKIANLFATAPNSPVNGTINDELIAPNTTWSSEKINDIINNIPTGGDSIDDTVTAPDTTWSSEKIAEMIEENKGDSIQPDWNQHDETAPDYVKNRTHYIERTSTVSFSEQVVQVGNDGYVDLYDIPLPGLTSNATCIVTIDGVSYETPAIKGVYNAYEWYVIGNGELLGEEGGDTTLPFGIFVDKYNENWMKIEGKTGEATLKIEIVGEVVHKIPEIYLPQKIGIEGTGSYSEIFNNLTDNKASGDYSHAENFKTEASGYASHAEGIGTVSKGYASHAEGCETQANGAYSHSEGYYSVCDGSYSHAEGTGTIAKGDSQHVSGLYNVPDETSLLIIGNGSGDNNRSNAFTLNKAGDGFFAGDVYVGSENKKLATEDYVTGNALIKTAQTLTNDELAQVRKNLRFIGKDVEGQEFTIDGKKVVASSNAEIFGDYETNIAVGQWSIAEGSGTVAKGRVSHAEGAFSQALNDGCHVEGYGTKATGYWSHAEGEMTIVSSYASHAEGSYCTMPDGTKRYSTAAGYASHTEGGGCHTTGVASHAEGIGTTASGRCSHVEGIYTIASGKCQHVEGNSNIEDTSDAYIHITGNGTSPTDRSNAYTLDWEGNAWFSGDVYVGSTSGTNKDDGSKKLATEDYVNETIASTSVSYTEEQQLTVEEVNRVRMNIHSVGQYTTGLSYNPFNIVEVLDYDEFTKELLDPVVAKQGAEIYNDYENNIATGMWACASGCGTQALGDFSDASGWLTKASGFCSIASGRQTECAGNYSHAEGHNTKAMANDTHAEGEGCQALNARAHAEGYFTTAKANQAHSEGMNTVASGINSHAEGWATTASGQNSFSGGKNTVASGTNSTARGLGTIAAGAQQFVNGKYNISDTNSLFILGNGSSETERSNAFKVDASGNAWLAGTVTATAILLKSSTEGSTKYFKLTIDDSGTLSITENV